MSTLPEQLFGSLTILDWLAISHSEFLTDLPSNIFENNTKLTILDLSCNVVNIWRSEWAQNLTNLRDFRAGTNFFIPKIPRNSLNARNLIDLEISFNQIYELNFFMFNDLNSLRNFDISYTLIDAIDYNLIDRATNLRVLLASNCNCVNRDFRIFHLNREAFMKVLEPCFINFDKRILSEFNSIIIQAWTLIKFPNLEFWFS